MSRYASHTIYARALPALCVWVTGCATAPSTVEVAQPSSVVLTTQPAIAKALALDASRIKPMYSEVLPIDLAAVVHVAVADSLDIQRARRQVEAMRGRVESAAGAAFPALVPTALFERVDGTVRATEGGLERVGFSTFQPSVAVQWVLNPGRVVYDIIAAKKRLSASEHDAEAVVQATLRDAAVQYYDLVLDQARISAAQRSVEEAAELFRINQLRVRSGTGVPADALRAEARLAERQQDLQIALNSFYQASVTLAVTLSLDASTTLIPKINTLPPIPLVSNEVAIGELMEVAVDHRPDLERLRTLLVAVAADKGSTWWGAFGPSFRVAYQYGGITGRAENVDLGEGIPSNLVVNPLSAGGSFNGNPVADGLIREAIGRGSRRLDRDRGKTFGFSDQQRFTAGVGWRLSLSAFGDLKTAGAVEQQAAIDLERRLDEVKAQIITGQQAARTHHELIRLAQQQVDASEEALRLTQANLQAGTMTTLDVLQSQDAVAQARLRYADAVVRYNQSQVNLLAALGLLDVSTLLPPGATEAENAS